MTVEYKILKQHNLIVGFQSGRADGSDASSAIRRVVCNPDFNWNMDRIFLIDEKTDMSRLNLDHLRTIKDEVMQAYFGDREPDPSDFPLYRVAIVCPQPGNAAMVKLYGTVWDTEQAPISEMKLFDTIPEALTWLGQDAVSEAEIWQAVAAP